MDPETGATYNAGALVGPQGYVGKYRKTGLNFADVMSFKQGNAGYPHFPTEYGNLTMLICYDDTFWEPGRVASLKGANLILHMVASGEASGSLDAMLARVARHLERDLERLVTVMLELFKPMMLLVMGGLVLVIVLAILLPILNLNQLIA
jgi:predicted amidohydrolase